MTQAKIIAMWSGPRNMSTAMMRSFGNRADCSALDEPFYAPWLKATGKEHPMRDEIVAAHETNPDRVAQMCLGPFTTEWCYQKHMPHHMIEGFPLDWTASMTNVFLTRHPRRVIASYWKKRGEVTDADIGYGRMGEIYDLVRSKGKEPIVVASEDILSNPEPMLGALCDAIGMTFDPAMLSWEPGPRAEDGAWGKHWYDAIWKSTGLVASDPGPLPDIPETLKSVEDALMAPYEAMMARRLKV